MEKNLLRNMCESARKSIVNCIKNGYEGYLCYFHNEVFNTDYEYTYIHDAINALEESGIFEAVGTIVEYEKDNFGQVNTDFTNPCNVANMLWYIIGEEELYDMFEGCPEWDEFWNEEIGEIECKVLLAWLKDNDKI